MAKNRGEWAELYVFLKLLGEGKIYAANENLERNPDSYLSILRIIRELVKDKLIEYKTGLMVEVCLDGELIISLPSSEFLAKAEKLHQMIQLATGRSFDVDDDMKLFQQQIKAEQPKSPSISSNHVFGGKNDIIMEVYDHSTALTTVAGFSIKSKYKNAATLFNAAKASSFVYKLVGASRAQVDYINQLNTKTGGKDKNARLQYIQEQGIGFEFQGAKILPQQEHSTFADNLEMVRGDMVEIMNEILLVQYFQAKDNCKLSDITKHLEQTNPLHKRTSGTFYQKAIKDLLYATFAGMTASKPWDGQSIVNGGYIVAKEDGEVLVYHTRDNESFRTFLFNNTRIDRPSSSASKYDYAHAYQEGEEYFFDLNFQIRFND